MKSFDKDPQALLDYVWDWTEWLGEDVIAEVEFTIPENLTQVGDADVSGGLVTLWLSGGMVNTAYIVTCQITTIGDRVDQRSARFIIKDR